MARLGKEQRARIAGELAGLSGRQRQEHVRAIQRQLADAGIHVSTRTIERCKPAGRAKRCDAGALRISVPDETLNWMYHLTIHKGYTAEMALDAAVNAGRLAPNQLSVSTYNRLLRERRISRRDNKRDSTPRRRWEAPIPNAVHQLDFTRAEQYWVRETGDVAFLKDWERNKNTDKKRKGHALWIYALIDDHARCVFAYAYPGLSTVWALDFLRRAWSPKADSPLQGMPAVLYSDNDAIFGKRADHKFRLAMEALGVDFQQHIPTHAWAKGKVEAWFRWINQQQATTRIEKFLTVAAFNAWLTDRCLAYNTRKHRTTGMRPVDRYLAGMRGQEVRAMPEHAVYEHLMSDTFAVLVDTSLRVRVPNRGTFQLPFTEPYHNWAGRTIEAAINPARPDSATLCVDGQEYEVENTDPTMHAAGEYHAAPLTDADAIRNATKGIDVSDAAQFGHATRAHEKVTYTPPRNIRPFDAARITRREPPVLDRMTAKLRIKDALDRDLTLVESRWLNAQLQHGVTEDDLPRLLAKVQAGECTSTEPADEAAAG